MTLIQGGVHAGSVIAAIAQEDLHRLGDLVEQGLDLGRVIDVAVGQDGGDDPAGHRVEADVQRSAACGCRASPLARPAQLQAGTIDHQVDRPASGAGLRRQFQALCPSAEGGEIWHRQVNAEQLEDGADQSLGLAQRQVEHCPQCQSCRDCQIRVVRLTTRRGPRHGFPGGDGLIRKPHGQTAPLPQRLVIRCPIRHASLWSWNMVAALYLCGMKARSGASKQIASYAIRHIRATRCRTFPCPTGQRPDVLPGCRAIRAIFPYR
jgi:hypothetical protein